MRFTIQLLRTLGRVLRAHGPAIVLIQLAAGILQVLHLSLAVELGRTHAVAGLLLSGFGTLMVVAGLVAICVVSHDQLETAGEPPKRGWARWQYVARIFSASILPFFVTYLAWGLYRADIQRYARDALNSLNFGAGEGGAGSIMDVRFTTISIAIIVVAFVGRMVAKRGTAPTARRTAVMVLLEAVWAFPAALLIARLIGDLTTLISNSAAAVWVHRVAGIMPWAEWMQTVLVNLGGVLHTMLTPLLWATLAGITVVRGTFEHNRLSSRLQATVDRLPPVLGDVVADVLIDLEDRWIPLIAAVGAMARAGAIALAGAVAAGVLTVVAGGWLTFGLAHLPTLATEPYTRILGEALIGLGTQLTLGATMVVALASFDTLRVLSRPSADGDRQPRPGFAADLHEQ